MGEARDIAVTAPIPEAGEVTRYAPQRQLREVWRQCNTCRRFARVATGVRRCPFCGWHDALERPERDPGELLRVIDQLEARVAALEKTHRGDPASPPIDAP